MKSRIFNLSQLKGMVADGYLIYDLEPDSTNRQLYWMHISQYDANHTLVREEDYVNMSAVDQAKQLHVLRALDKPYSEVALPMKQYKARLSRYLNSEDVVNLPLFGYATDATDLPILNKLVHGSRRTVYDLARAYGVATKKPLISLDILAHKLSQGKAPKQASRNHNPAQDVELTNYVLQGMLNI